MLKLAWVGLYIIFAKKKAQNFLKKGNGGVRNVYIVHDGKGLREIKNYCAYCSSYLNDVKIELFILYNTEIFWQGMGVDNFFA